MFKFPNIPLLLTLVVILLMILAINISQTNAARTSDVWQERLGSYIETTWSEGRDILINGTNKYLNFGIDSGSTGYGIRDNSGDIEYKDDGGSWTPFNAISGGGGGASSTIVKIDGTISNTNVPTLDFNSNDISITESPTDEFNISVSDNITFSNTTTTNATSTNLAVTSAFNFLGTWITNVSTWFNGLFDTQLATKDTGDLAEGSNLYYTLARVQTALVSGYSAVFGSATSTNLTVTGTLTGDLTGNADTATALSANGSNCSAGNAPLGVDENGAVESCYDVFTQAENDLAGYLTSYTETDPIWIASSSEYFSLSAWGATTTDGLTQGSTNLYNQTHNGEVTGATSLTVTDNIIDEANLKINTPTDNYILVASSTASGGLEWVATSTARLGFGSGTTINSLEDIADVASMSQTGGDLLYWNGTNWSNLATTSLGVSWNNLVDIPAGFADGVDDTAAGGSGLGTTSPWTVGQIVEVANGGTVRSTSTIHYSLLDSAVILLSEIDTESELENILTDVTDIFTNNDGALNDDDITNDSIESLSDVASMSQSTGDVMYWNGSSWTNTATTTWDTNTQLSQEQVEDYAGAMVIGNTETLITVTYQDGDGTVDYVVDNDLANYSNSTSLFLNGVTALGIEKSGTNIALTSGYNIPLTASTTNWNTAFDWGNHASQMYLTTVDISDNTNLAGDTEIVLTGDTLSIASTIARDSELHNAVTLGGSLDYLTLSTQVLTLNAIDLTTDVEEILPQANGGTGTTTQLVWSRTIASTSPAFISGGLMPLTPRLDGGTISRIICNVYGGTSKVIAIEDASANSSEDITCGTTTTTDDGSITNATYTALEQMYIDFGATTGAVDYVNISIYK